MRTNSEKWLNYVGELCVPKKKDGESQEEYEKKVRERRYIKISKDFAVPEKAYIRLEKYTDYLEGRKKSGMSQEDYDRAIQKTYIKHVLHVAPQEDMDIPEQTEDLFRSIEVRRKCKNNYYILTKAAFVAKKDSFIHLRKVSETILAQFEKGLIDAETRDKRLDGIRAKDENGKPTSDFWLIYVGDVRIE